MKVIISHGKLNVVDSNNNFVGYDLCANCCEDFGWFISDEEQRGISGNNYSFDLDPFCFDINYFKVIKNCNKDDYEELNIVRFKLTHEGKAVYLHLYNCHNGYYSHLVEANMGNQLIEDSL